MDEFWSLKSHQVSQCMSRIVIPDCANVIVIIYWYESVTEDS